MRATDRAYALGYFAVGILWVIVVIVNWGW